MKNTVQLETLKAETLPELQGWKEKQKTIVKENPFVAIADHKTYEQAKKHRTTLVTARTDIQKQEKLIASKIKDFRNKVAEASKNLIEITLPHEEKQQEEVRRYEVEKEAERLEKERIERERKDAIQKDINDFYVGWKNKIQSFEFSDLGTAVHDLEATIEEFSEKDLEEFDMDFSEKTNLLIAQLKERKTFLAEREEARKERERLAEERKAYEAQMQKERSEREAEAEKIQKDREELEAEKAEIEADRKAKEDAERKEREAIEDKKRKEAEAKRLKELQPDKKKAEEVIKSIFIDFNPEIKIKDKDIDNLLGDYIGEADLLMKKFLKRLSEIK